MVGLGAERIPAGADLARAPSQWLMSLEGEAPADDRCGKPKFRLRFEDRSERGHVLDQRTNRWSRRAKRGREDHSCVPAPGPENLPRVMSTSVTLIPCDIHWK